MLFQLIVYIPVIFGIILIALFTVYRQSKKSTTLFSILAFTIALWLLLQLCIQTKVLRDPLLFARLTDLVSNYLAYFFLLFMLAYPENIKWQKFKRLASLLIIPPLLFTPLAFTSLMLNQVSVNNSGFSVTGAGVLYSVQLSYIAGYLLAGFILIVASTISKPKDQRKKNYWLIVALFQAGALNLLTNSVFARYAATQLLTPISLFAMIVLITYAVVKHRLFDLRLIIARSIAYVAALVVLASIYGLLIFGVLNLIFKLEIPVSVQIFISAATAVSALTFARLKKFFDRVTNTIFYRDAYDPEVLYDKLNKLLVSTYDLEPLLMSVSTLLASELKATFVAIELKEIVGQGQRFVGTEKLKMPLKDILAVRRQTTHFRQNVVAVDALDDEKSKELKKILHRNEIAVIVQLASGARRTADGLGYLMLGAKRSGNQYTQQDLRVLETVANELILAIQNALHFEEIQNFNLTLQEKVIEATKQLRKTNEKLKALDETKDDFISMASHQLRTPLTSVKGYLSLVLDGDAGPIKPTQRELLSQAFTSSQRMVYLISDLLNVSRLRTGKFVINAEPINLAEVITSELAQLKETAATRSLELKYDKPAHFPQLLFDETKTRQVIMNFVDNAIYYTPAGGHITVELEDKPTTIELRVIDNGIGVPKSEQRHLFTKFYRAGNARKARPDGTGLGLFMAKKVIAAQGGAIIFESEENRGSTFGFIFSKSKLTGPRTPSISVD